MASLWSIVAANPFMDGQPFGGSALGVSFDAAGPLSGASTTSSDGGTGTAAGAVLPLAELGTLISWRALRRQRLLRPSQIPLAVPVPPG
jgi:hypothetical protein